MKVVQGTSCWGMKTIEFASIGLGLAGEIIGAIDTSAGDTVWGLTSSSAGKFIPNLLDKIAISFLSS